MYAFIELDIYYNPKQTVLVQTGHKMVNQGALPIDIVPFEVKVKGFNILPLLVKMNGWMPEKMRKKMVSKQNAPTLAKLPRDLHDLNGKSPYLIEDIIENKMWQVTYTFEQLVMTDKKTASGLKILGIDPTSEKFKSECLAGAATHGQEAVEVCKKDFETMLKWMNKTNLTQEDLETAFNNETRMFVVKLNSGSLLLYNPCKIRVEHGFKDWLESLGKVEWIVIGSCYHTNWLHGVFKT